MSTFLTRLLAALRAPLTAAPRAPRPNPLLARPPRGVHGASVPGESTDDVDLGARGRMRFRSALGRAPTPEDYVGVHTTGSLALAAFYALTATRHLGSSFRAQEDYPVVFLLDVTGLEALPDVDAMMEGAERFDDSTRRTVERALADDDGRIWRLSEEFDESTGFDDWTNDAWTRLGEIASGNPVRAVVDAVGGDKDRAREVLAQWVDTGELDPVILTHLVDQRRYLADFPRERVVEVLAIQPIWREVVPTQEDERRAVRLEKRGWQVVSDEEDVPGSIDPTVATIWRNPSLATATPAATQYHGTSSALAREAFPDLPWPARAPFPVR